MAPIIKVFGMEMNSWGLFHALAACSALFIIVSYLRKGDKTFENIWTLAVLCAGTPIAYVLSRFLEALHKIILNGGNISFFQGISTSGSTSIGVVLAAILLVILTGSLIRVHTSRMLTAIAMALPTSVILGRIGCFLAGDGCYGVKCDWPWAMRFPNGTIPTSDLVHPIPLYEIINMLLLLVLVARKMKAAHFAHKRDSLYLLIFLGYAIQRFILEFFRPYAIIGVLTYYQWLALLIMTIVTGYAVKEKELSFRIYRRQHGSTTFK